MMFHAHWELLETGEHRTAQRSNSLGTASATGREPETTAVQQSAPPPPDPGSRGGRTTKVSGITVLDLRPGQ